RVGHYRPGKAQKIVQALLYCFMSQFRILVNYVAVGDNHLRTHKGPLLRRDQGKVGVDHRHQKWSLYSAMRSRKPADPSGQIFMQYLEAVRHMQLNANKE